MWTGWASPRSRITNVLLIPLHEWLPCSHFWSPSRKYSGTTSFHHDLPSTITSSSPYLYADDTKICKRILSSQDTFLLQSDLDHLSQWCLDNDMSFNISKSCLLRFHNRTTTTTSSNYTVNDTSITSLDHCRDLGVIFSTDLSWTKHYYNAITAKAYQSLGLIRRTFSPFIPTSIKKLLFISLVKSKLTYCSPVWRPHLIRDIKLLERIQRRATKYILNDFVSDYKSRLINLHLFPLMYSYELADVLLLVKNLKDPDPSSPSRTTSHSLPLTLDQENL